MSLPNLEQLHQQYQQYQQSLVNPGLPGQTGTEAPRSGDNLPGGLQNAPFVHVGNNNPLRGDGTRNLGALSAPGEDEVNTSQSKISYNHVAFGDAGQPQPPQAWKGGSLDHDNLMVQENDFQNNNQQQNHPDYRHQNNSPSFQVNTQINQFSEQQLADMEPLYPFALANNRGSATDSQREPNNYAQGLHYVQEKDAQEQMTDSQLHGDDYYISNQTRDAIFGQ